MGTPGARGRRIRRAVLLAAALVVVATLLRWAVGRWTAEGRRLTVHRVEAARGEAASPADTVGETELRVVTWNIAHGRGDDTTGWLANWTVERGDRLRRVAEVLRRVEADVVVLNEVDFDAAWSGGVNQAAEVARAGGYGTWVEQRNFDVRLPFLSFAFGNAVLSRLPVLDARWLELPVRSRLEKVLAGAKASATVRIRTARGPVTVVPVHLEFRPGPTRREAVPVFDSVRGGADAPVILAGDFNAAPPGWSGVAGPTVLGLLLEAGWRSPRAEAGSRDVAATWPTPAPRRALDWVLVAPPLEVVETRVLEEAAALSDHAPVLSVVRLPAGRAARGSRAPPGLRRRADRPLLLRGAGTTPGRGRPWRRGWTAGSRCRGWRRGCAP